MTKLSELERDPVTQGLSLQSFLTLPMQRITRLPLLVDVSCDGRVKMGVKTNGRFLMLPKRQAVFAKKCCLYFA